MEKHDHIHQGGKLLQAPSMQLSQYLFSRKGGHNFLRRAKQPTKPKIRGSSNVERLNGFNGMSEDPDAVEPLDPGTGDPGSGDRPPSGSRSPRSSPISRSNTPRNSQSQSQPLPGPSGIDLEVPAELPSRHTNRHGSKASKVSGAEASHDVMHMGSHLQVPENGGSPLHRRAPSHESMGSRSEQGTGNVEQSIDESGDNVKRNSSFRNNKNLSSVQDEIHLKPRSKATNSQKALIQKQRLRSMSKNNLKMEIRKNSWLIGLCVRIVEHVAFVASVVLVIFIQSIYMGVEDEGSLVVDVLFTAFYLVELTLRLIAYGSDFFKSAFNLMDLGLIVLSFVDLLIVIIQGSSSLDVMVSLRLARLLRLGGLVRLLRFFKPLYLLVAGIMVSLKTVVWAWILMSLIIYVFGLVFYRALKPDLCTGGQEDELLNTYFGTLSLSVFTVFQITTLEDWPNISDVMAKYHAWLSAMVVVLLMLTAYGVMNVTVAIFVNSAMDASSVRSRDIAKKAKDEYKATCESLKQVFMDADKNGNGNLSKEEFEKAIYQKNLLGRLRSAGIDVESAAQLFDILDMDGSGTLDGNEFVEGVLRSRGPAQNKDLVGLRCDVWRANLSVQEEIRLVSLYFEGRLQETREKMMNLKEVAGPVLQRAAEEVRKKPDLKKKRPSHGAVHLGMESTEDHDESLMSIGGRPSEKSANASLFSAPLSPLRPPGSAS